MTSHLCRLARIAKSRGRVRLGVARRRLVVWHERHGCAEVVSADRDRLISALRNGREARRTSLVWAGGSLRLLAMVLLGTGDAARASRVLARSVEQCPDEPATLALIARLAQDTGPRRVILDQHAGQVRGRGVDERLLTVVLDRAQRNENEPALMKLLAQYGGRVGRDAVAAAERAVELAPQDAAAWHLLGRARIDDAYSRGAQTVAEMDAVRDAFHRSLALDPLEGRSRFSLVRSYVSTGEWESAFAASGSGDQPISLAEVTAKVASDPCRALELSGVLPPDAWYAVSAALLAEGRVVAASAAKDAMARSTLESTGPYRAVGLGPSLNAVRALVHLGECDAANERLGLLSRESLPEREAVAVERLVADLAFHRGATDAPRWIQSTSAVDGAAEALFRGLVEGRSIAVVGPAASEALDGEAIDSHDLVVRTKFVPGRAAIDAEKHGRRTDIAYYTDSSARFFEDDIASALGSGALKVAVLRPTALRAGRWTGRTERVRHAPAEDTVPFQCTHYAIQRILYDLLRYSPGSIALFGVDFFTGSSTYLDGYDSEVADVYEPSAFRPIVSTAMHDLRQDFRFTQMLVRRGLIAASPPVEEILATDVAAYLRAVEAGAMLSRGTNSSDKFVR